MMIISEEPKGFADPTLLGKIDKLFACNVGQHINLPQLIVVGDQSSGKSSVLEGLTDLPFPRDSGLCTRFATQITFRRSVNTRVAITIIPGPNASEEHKDSIRAWAKADMQTFDGEKFRDIMAEVHKVMGLSVKDTDPLAKKDAFSEDILSLEVCGPNQEHLSVIDIPGLFENPTEGVTTKADIIVVKNMVRRYMENHRSIILAVVPANVDPATQTILRMADELDPNGIRTLGVLTKPDLVDKGAEHGVVDLVEGRKHKLNLGWCLVRNLGQAEVSDGTSSRHAAEKAFFEQHRPWSTLDKDKVGVGSLKTRLREILARLIHREFVKVKSEISKKLIECKRQLESLGMKRGTEEEQRQYLLELTMAFQNIVNLAIDAKYGSDEIFEQLEGLRLITKIADRNEMFANDVAEMGNYFPFHDGSIQTPVDSDNELEEDSEETNSMEGFQVRRHVNFPELEDILYDTTLAVGTGRKDILTWLTLVYKGSRAFDMGTFSPYLLATTMKKQSINWDGLALGYISDVVCIVHDFIHRLLQATCPEETIKTRILSQITDDLVQMYKKAFDHVRFILQVERAGNPLTLNHYFNDSLEKCRQERIQAAMESKSFHCLPKSHVNYQKEEVVRLSDIKQSHPMSNIEYTVHDIHDILKSYYKVARKRFVDNICMQAANHFLLTGPDTPLKLFSPSYVSKLTTEQLEEIAGEDGTTRRKRKQLEKEIKELEAGRKIVV